MIVQIHVKIEVKTDDFRFLWLKKVHGFDPSVHCAKCLLGSYVKGLPFRGTKTGFTLDTDVDMDEAKYLYLCGVAGRWADNLHLAMEPAEGEEVCYEDDRIRVRVTGARLLTIPELPESARSLLTRPFHTCRNFRFGWTYFSENRCRNSAEEQLESENLRVDKQAVIQLRNERLGMDNVDPPLKPRGRKRPRPPRPRR